MATSTAEPDMSLIAELLEMIDREPPALGARKLLVEQYIAVGWLDAARDTVQDLKRLSPGDAEVEEWTKALVKPSTSTSTPQAAAPPPNSSPRRGTTFTKVSVTPATLPQDPKQLATVKEDFITGLKNLRARARNLLKDTKLLANLESHANVRLRSTSHIDDLQALAEGRITGPLRHLPPSGTGADGKSALQSQPQSVRAVAREMNSDHDRALDIAVADFISIVNWQRSRSADGAPTDNDAARETLAKRSRALKAALPEALQNHPSTALMHIEHEMLERKYVNDETMLGDSVGDIPRDAFFVSEDGYAWDMDELVQAITANGGVMRNPLSKHMFSAEDVSFIVQHPKGKSLAAMQIEQQQLSMGVRPATIEQMDKLAKTLLDDQSADQIPSRQALDEFFAYIATLPQSEQKALDKLRVPAKDSHTGQAFDGSIGESIRDRDRICMHKLGDFLQQAAKHLRKR